MTKIAGSGSISQKQHGSVDPDPDASQNVMDPEHWPKTLLLMPQAIRDGVIEASLDHENGWMQSKDTSDIYATRQDHTHTHRQSFQSPYF
jgi:hypothetical protein